MPRENTDFGFRPDAAIQEREQRRKQKLADAETQIKRARQAEKQADPSQMSPEDRAIFWYLKAVTTMLEQDYDIVLDASSGGEGGQ
jgi:uncharacterized iron-regulated membrane protein